MRHHHRVLPRVLLIAPLFVVAASACQDRRRDEPGERPRAGAEVSGRTEPKSEPDKTQPTATVAEVKGSPANFYDKDVRVAGKVDAILGDRAFELEGAGWAFNDNITVLTKTPVQFTGVGLARRDEVIVDGKVRRFVTAEIERDLGWDLSPEIEVRLKERPVLVADSIRRITESGRWNARPAREQPVAALVAIVTAIDPNLLVGKSVDLDRERVQAVMGKGLWIGPSRMSQIYVLPDTLPPDLKPGDTVHVRGTLKKAPPDALKTWGLPGDLTGLVDEQMLFVADAKVDKEVATGT